MSAPAVIAPAAHDRAKFIGGSDIAAVLGISPWRTPLELWRDKTTPRVEGGPARPQLTRGHRWEAVVGEMLVEALQRDGHEVEIVAANRRYADPDLPFLAAEIDFELRIDGADEVTNCELKTVHPFRMREWGDSGSDDLPTHYTAQVMHGLGVTRRRRGILAALFGADELRAYPVAADDETIAALRARASAFWTDHVLTGLPPAPVNADDLAILFPTESSGPPLLADEELAARVMRLRALHAELKAREAEAEAVEFDIRRAMRDAAELVMPNGKTAATWKERSGSWLDETALKEAHPKLAREFTRKWTKRVFTLKPFETKRNLMSTATLKAVATQAAGTALAEKKQDPAAALVEKLKGQMALALPKHMTAERMARIVLTDMRRVPKLMECTQQSLAGAIMASAQLGLEPGNGLGHAYLLPFDKRAKVNGQWQTVATECQLIIGYRGMIDLARRSGQIVSLSARTVHEKDHFTYRYGIDETVEHVPADGERGQMTYVYAVAKLRDGGVQFEVMSRTEIDKVRAQSKAKDSGPWVTHFEEMAKKTAIRRLFKYLPVSVEMARAITMDEQAEAGVAQDHNVIDGMVAEMQAPGAGPFDLAAALDRLRACPDRDALALLADDLRLAADGNDEALAAIGRAFDERDAELAA